MEGNAMERKRQRKGRERRERERKMTEARGREMSALGISETSLAARNSMAVSKEI